MVLTVYICTARRVNGCDRNTVYVCLGIKVHAHVRHTIYILILRLYEDIIYVYIYKYIYVLVCRPTSCLLNI